MIVVIWYLKLVKNKSLQLHKCWSDESRQNQQDKIKREEATPTKIKTNGEKYTPKAQNQLNHKLSDEK